MSLALAPRRRSPRRRDTPRGKPLRLGILLADNFTLTSFSLFVDIMRLAADEGDRSNPVNIQWQIMSARTEPVRASCGAPVGRTSGLIDPHDLDYVVIVGGVLHRGRQIDAETEQYLHEAARAGTTLVGVCTASFILCRAGLMKGRRSCVHWFHYQDFVDEFPDQDVMADRLFFIDGDRITCVGGAGAADLASHLAERRLGHAVVEKARQIMQLERLRTADDAQSHPPLSAQATDPRVRRALLLMEQNMTQPLPMAELAERLELSLRQVERLFHAAFGRSPAEMYRVVRMRYAAWLLHNTRRSVTEIAAHAGFSDCAHFSRQYRRLHGVAPSKRRTLRASPPKRSELLAIRVVE